MTFREGSVLLGRGTVTGAVRRGNSVFYYTVEGDTVRERTYRVGEKGVSGDGVIAGYAQAYTVSGGTTAEVRGGEVRVSALEDRAETECKESEGE